MTTVPNGSATTEERQRRRGEIIAELSVGVTFDAESEIERRVRFLRDAVRSSGTTGLVLGISGGVDSSTTGRLCQLAVERIRSEGGSATFVAMRLPYGVQHDEDDAAKALEFVRPDETVTVNVGPASDAMLTALDTVGELIDDPAARDFVHGNIKARQRMIAQYAVAGARRMLVVGTDHAAEAVMGFFTKHGDGACDLTPLTGLTKRRVRALASTLGAPSELVDKVPTADLESGDPGKPDEHAFGITYDDIDDFLEDRPIGDDVADVVFGWHARTVHKRALPIAP